MIEYSITIKNAMLQVVADALNAADPEPARLQLYTATQPTPGADITDQILLADCPLALPCGTVSGGVLNLTLPIEDDNLPASGTITWGRLVDGADNWIADLDVEIEPAEGEPESAAAIQLNAVIVYKGGILRLTGTAMLGLN